MSRFSPLLFSFPSTYKGYKLNTDFRIGIMIRNLILDEDIDEKQKILDIIDLLFVDDYPRDEQLLSEIISWFMQLGYNKGVNDLYSDTDDDVDLFGENSSDDDSSDECSKKSGELPSSDEQDVVDFEFDSARIYTGFLRTYGIDLSVEHIHYWKFMFMLGDLDTDCSHNRVVEIRTTSLKDMKGDQRKAYLRLKKLYKIPTKVSEKTRQFLESLGFDEDDMNLYLM